MQLTRAQLSGKHTIVDLLTCVVIVEVVEMLLSWLISHGMLSLDTDCNIIESFV